MKYKGKRPELVAPAGNYEKMLYASAYGADAVYFGGTEFGLRVLAENFTFDDMVRAISYLHSMGRKAYITMNIMARNGQLKNIAGLAAKLDEAGADAFIVSDLGVLASVRSSIRRAAIHISTQAYVTNHKAAEMYHSLGAKRIILARELSLDEITEIRHMLPAGIELEVFVHGAMCISYSGRCLLSSYMAYRDSNQGNCAQACRWKYSLMEERRPGEYYPVFEDENGSYILNSMDLCLIDIADKLVEAGVDAFKIEGRMKSVFYVASVTRIYKEAIDSYIKGPDSYVPKECWNEELRAVSHRKYTKGFSEGTPGPGSSVTYESSSYIRPYTFCGVVTGYDHEKQLLVVEQRNNFGSGDMLEIVTPDRGIIKYSVRELFDENHEKTDRAPHPKMKLYLPYQGDAVPEYSLLRRKDDKGGNDV